MEHVTIYNEPGRFAGWPANYGIWGWGDEIVTGFFLGHLQAGEQYHARDKSRPFIAVQARSVDGGSTWNVHDTPITQPAHHRISADEHMNPNLWVANTLHENDLLLPPPGNIRFTHPDFAMMCHRTGLRAGSRSWFYVSYDRCRSWEGPYRLPMFDQSGIAARTDYIVDGPESCTLFLTASKPDGDEGRVFCARTTDAGKSFHFVNWATDDPVGYTIMPASVRLPSGRLLCSVRCNNTHKTPSERRCWIELWASDDDGSSWRLLATPVENTGYGGNPPTLTILQDGHLCVTYGYRNAPFEIRTTMSYDGGESWSAPRTLRDGAGNHDLGYTRTVQRADGKMVTVYYWNYAAEGERTLEATIWEP